MPVTIIEKPYPFDFGENLLAFKLQGSPIIANGSPSVTRFQISTMPHSGYSIFIGYGTHSFVFTIASANAAQHAPYKIANLNTLSDIRAELEKKIAGNHYISQSYSVSVSPTLGVTFTSVVNGMENVTITSNDPLAIITQTSQVTGISKSRRQNYQIYARITVSHYKNGLLKTETLPDMLTHIDDQGRTRLYLNVLRPYFTQTDIPIIGEVFAAYVLKYATLKFSMTYSDCFGAPPQVQIPQETSSFYIAAGKLSEECKALNIPDWATPMGASVKFSNFPRPRNYGSANSLTLRSFKEMPQYAYFMLFNFSATPQFTFNLDVTIDVLKRDGTSILNRAMESLIVPNFNIVRIPLSVSALALSSIEDEILTYKVKIRNQNTSEEWSRTFLLQRRPFFSQIFLLQNKQGILESFFIDNEKTEKIVEGDEVTCNGQSILDITSKDIVYTARTGFKSKHEIELLSDAVGNKFNYKIIDEVPKRITILPDSLVVKDDSEDLQSAEFQYKISEAYNDQGVTAQIPPSLPWDDTAIINDQHVLSPTLERNQLSLT